MLMKLLVNVFERARSKLTVARSSSSTSIPSDSDIEISNLDVKPNKSKSSIIQHQPRSSFSKWLCTTPTSIDKPISNRVRRSNSWRSLKDRGNHSFNSRTYSVDELHRNNKHRGRDGSHPRQSSHTRFDRLSSNFVDYSNPKKKSPRRKQQQIFSTLSHHSNGGDSGYSEESFPTRTTYQRPLHTSCPHCHCEQRSSFNNYQKSSSDSSPSDYHPKSYENFLTDSHIKLTRTLADKRRRNLSCDGSLWTRPQSQKRIIPTSSPVFSEPRHLGMTHCHPSNTYTKPSNNVFGELNVAAIELDSLRTSFSSSSYSSSSSASSHREKNSRKQLFLVWNEYENPSLYSKMDGTKTFAVRRGDQVRLLKRMGKSTLLVQKQDDGSIGFLPQTCLAHHQINSFLSLKGLRETVL